MAGALLPSCRRRRILDARVEGGLELPLHFDLELSDLTIAKTCMRLWVTSLAIRRIHEKKIKKKKEL